jgi:hypothetical protein
MPACGRKKYVIAEPRRLIDPAAWDGNDLFIVWPLPKYRFVSSRLGSILPQGEVSGAKLVPAPKTPVERGALVGPASITYWMPEARARLGEFRYFVMTLLGCAWCALASRNSVR